MHQQLLATHPDATLRVYVVWLAMLPQDQRSAWDGSLVPDRRVTHLWDRDRTVGRWFAEQVEQRRGVVWDTYLLYGPDAQWTTTLDHPLGKGSTMIAKRAALAAQLRPLLRSE